MNTPCVYCPVRTKESYYQSSLGPTINSDIEPTTSDSKGCPSALEVATNIPFLDLDSRYVP